MFNGIIIELSRYIPCLNRTQLEDCLNSIWAGRRFDSTRPRIYLLTFERLGPKGNGHHSRSDQPMQSPARHNYAHNAPPKHSILDASHDEPCGGYPSAHRDRFGAHRASDSGARCSVPGGRCDRFRQTPALVGSKGGELANVTPDFFNPFQWCLCFSCWHSSPALMAY